MALLLAWGRRWRIEGERIGASAPGIQTVDAAHARERENLNLHHAECGDPRFGECALA
jgi:hypothetical protein